MPPPHKDDGYYHEYRMDDDMGRQIQTSPVQMQEVREEKIEPAPVEAVEEQVDMRVETAAAEAHTAPSVEAQAPAAPPKQEVQQVQPRQVQPLTETGPEDLETADADDAASLPPFEDGRIFPFDDILSELHNFRSQNGHANIPVNHPAFGRILDVLVSNDIERETDKKWESNCNVLKEYKDKYGDCDIPHTDPNMGEWIELHRKLKAEGASDPLTLSRFAKLDSIGFDWSLPIWDRRLQELTAYAELHGHTDVPLNHPGGLGVWVVNQKFNLHEMPPQRIAALDAINFIWNHNRKRKNGAWDKMFDQLVSYIAKHNTANVPTTSGHSKLSKWVGKQREEYKRFMNKESSQLDRVRIERLNEVGFQWSIQNWTVVPWEDRFEVSFDIGIGLVWLFWFSSDGFEHG